MGSLAAAAPAVQLMLGLQGAVLMAAAADTVELDDEVRNRRLGRIVE